MLTLRPSRRRARQLLGVLRHPVEQLRLWRAMSRARRAGIVATRSVGARHGRFKYIGDYLAAPLSRRERLAALIYHHEFVARHAAAHGDALWRAPFTLWERHDDERRHHALLLTPARLAPMEGEVELAFLLDGQRLFTLTFALVSGTLIGAADAPVLLVGGLQGGYQVREELRYAARANGEIAAPTLLLLAAATLAEALGAALLAGPSNRTQVAAGYVVDGRSSSLDYDELWAKLDGERTAADFFLVDPRREEPEESEVSGKHRSRTRRRRRLRAALRAEMLAALAPATGRSHPAGPPS
ncbi:DUF535 family protein [Sphingomonas sp. BK580]|uniref:DUF535 family protein n=1 Tax=Sphingomonas sp. BK580 TaxID=2586972 RepID=UPI00162050C9|nr:DUF535 family protein [Sphingomonas sp. BK580]MBB3695380.1 uncharacterized protein VirK/YbjX [Sphingomonas sp. BK580]